MPNQQCQSTEGKSTEGKFTGGFYDHFINIWINIISTVPYALHWNKHILLLDDKWSCNQTQCKLAHQSDGLNSSSHVCPETVAESQSILDRTFHTSNANLQMSKPNITAAIPKISNHESLHYTDSMFQKRYYFTFPNYIIPHFFTGFVLCPDACGEAIWGTMSGFSDIPPSSVLTCHVCLNFLHAGDHCSDWLAAGAVRYWIKFLSKKNPLPCNAGCSQITLGILVIHTDINTLYYNNACTS